MSAPTGKLKFAYGTIQVLEAEKEAIQRRVEELEEALGDILSAGEGWTFDEDLEEAFRLGYCVHRSISEDELL